MPLLRSSIFVSLASVGLLLIGSPNGSTAQKGGAFVAPIVWKKLGSGATARFASTCVWAPKSGSILVYAGESKKDKAFAVFDDLWEYQPTNDTWKPLKTNGEAPAGRAYHSATFDAKRNAMWVFGGADRSLKARDDLWKLDVEKRTWIRISPVGEKPGARFNAGFHYDEKRDQLVLWSGCKAFFAPDNAWPDVWTYDIENATWTKHAASAPARWQAASVLAPELDALIVHGGFDGNSTVRGDTWMYPLATDKWVELGKGFKATDAHAAVWDPVAQQMIVHGGATGGTSGLDEMWTFDPKKKKWTELKWKGEDPGARAYHVAVWCPTLNGLWLFGGTMNQFYDEMRGNEAWVVALHK